MASIRLRLADRAIARGPCPPPPPMIYAAWPRCAPRYRPAGAGVQDLPLHGHALGLSRPRRNPAAPWRCWGVAEVAIKKRSSLTTLAFAARRVLAARGLRRPPSGQCLHPNEGALRDLLRGWASPAPTVTEPAVAAAAASSTSSRLGDQGPVLRLDLFGQLLDGARRFDPVSQRTTEKLDRVELAPMSEFPLTERVDHPCSCTLRRARAPAAPTIHLLERVSAGRQVFGVPGQLVEQPCTVTRCAEHPGRSPGTWPRRVTASITLRRPPPSRAHRSRSRG